MPAANTNNILTLPRIARPGGEARQRPVRQVLTAPRFTEGAGFQVRRPFAGLEASVTDPFLLLDHLGAVEYAPGEAKGAPWHPHRGFETVTYIIDGAFQHTDSTGGGGLITNGGTQWMTAGAGILHDELPTEELVRKGGLFHGAQLWVNLPSELKMTPPRYQDIGADRVVLLASEDGGALVRLIAGDLGEPGGAGGAGQTWTPITYVHASISPGARLELPWRPEFNALAYVLSGRGHAGAEAAPIEEGQLAVYGDGDSLLLEAEQRQGGRSPNLEVLLLGGRPIGEPVVFYGPFVMNTRQEIVKAIEDYQAGRMGRIPATVLNS